MKNYTDIELSKKLAEILPLESADGFWEYHNKWYSEGEEWEGYEYYPRAEPYLEYTRKENEWKEDKSDVPCWSLIALLNVLPEPQLTQNSDGRWMLRVWDEKRFPYSVGGNVNPVEACVDMIIKLYNLNLL